MSSWRFVATGAEKCQLRTTHYPLSTFRFENSMRRMHLFEFHEQNWMPPIVRDSVVECLYHILRRRRMAAGMMDPWLEFLRRSKATQVLDLCSGAGGPSLTFAEELQRRKDDPPRIVLSDLFPRPEVWAAARDELDVNVDFWPQPVDATRVPSELSSGCVRMINNAFHHFPPTAAAAILKDAVDNSSGIFISEAYPRGLMHFLRFVWADPLLPFALPVFTPSHKFKKALLTLCVPVIPVSILWDGLVSALRMYTEAELCQMVAPLGDRFEWEYGTFRDKASGIATYFYGVPR